MSKTKCLLQLWFGAVRSIESFRLEVTKAVDNLCEEIVFAGTYLANSMKFAEVLKVVEKAQRRLNIAYVNKLSVIVNRMSIDTQEVLTAAATKWTLPPFSPGLVGGHCTGVDPSYLTHKAQELGYQPLVILSGRRINDNMGGHAARNFIRLMLRNCINVAQSPVGVLGVTFKENCRDVRNSRVIDTIYSRTRFLGCKDRGIRPLGRSPGAQEAFDEYGAELSALLGQERLDSIFIAVATKRSPSTPYWNFESSVSFNQNRLSPIGSLFKRG